MFLYLSLKDEDSLKIYHVIINPKYHQVIGQGLNFTDYLLCIFKLFLIQDSHSAHTLLW